MYIDSLFALPEKKKHVEIYNMLFLNINTEEYFSGNSPYDDECHIIIIHFFLGAVEENLLVLHCELMKWNHWSSKMANLNENILLAFDGDGESMWVGKIQLQLKAFWIERNKYSCNAAPSTQTTFLTSETFSQNTQLRHKEKYKSMWMRRYK